MQINQRRAISSKQHNLVKQIRRDHQLIIMSIPVILFFLVFHYAPMGGLLIAFVDFKPMRGIFGSHFVGFKHFQSVFTNPFFPRLLSNTFMIGVQTLVWSFPIPIIFALCVNEVRSSRMKKVVQTISYMPYFISVVVIVGLMISFLSPTTGVVNMLYTRITNNDAVNFMTEAKYFRFLYIFSHIWQTFGWNSIIYFAALTNVDPMLYDSAKVDGANRIQQLIHITLPSIRATILIMLLLNMGNMMSVGYEKIILMYSPGIYEVADVISTFTYRRGIVQSDYSYGTAIGLFNSAINLVFIFGSNWLSRRFAETSLW